MDAYFNELSCFPLCESKEYAKERAYKFASLLSETKKQGFNVVRCHDRGMAEILLCQDYSIADFCNENLRGIKEMLLLSMLHPPYFKPGSEEEKTYIENTFSVSVTNDLNQEERKPAYGLSAVCLYNSIGQNLCSCDFWEQSKEYVIYDVDDSGKEKEHKVLSFSNPEDYKTLEYKQWQAKTQTKSPFPRGKQGQIQSFRQFFCPHRMDSIYPKLVLWGRCKKCLIQEKRDRAGLCSMDSRTAGGRVL